MEGVTVCGDQQEDVKQSQDKRARTHAQTWPAAAQISADFPCHAPP
jgi:hypothetical protein